MNISAEALRELHRIHRQLADLRERLERGPKQIRAGEANAQHMETQLAEQKQQLKRARMTADEKQLQLKSREDRIADLQVKLNTASSNKEYQALKEQIAADEQANSVLSDEILEMLEKLDELEENVKQTEVNQKKSAEDLQKVKARVQEEQVKLEEELGRVTAEKTRAESTLPAEFKQEYERMTKARGEDALAPVENDCCGNCYHSLSPQIMNDLYMSKPVFCKSCGSLLYLSEDTRP